MLPCLIPTQSSIHKYNLPVSYSSHEDLAKLSSLGHFLKGSSAALGIIKVQASCEKMQHYGNCRDEEAGADLDSAEALKRIEALLVKCKKDYKAAKNWMVKMYDDLK